MVVQNGLRDALWDAGIPADHRWTLVDLGPYALCHIMHLALPQSPEFARHLLAQRKPYVVSTIFHPGVVPDTVAREVAEGAAAVVCASEGERNHLAPILAGLEEKAHVIGHGVDEAFHRHEVIEPTDLGRPYALCVGRLQREKGQEVFLEVCARLGLQGVLVGDMVAEQKEYGDSVLAAKPDGHSRSQALHLSGLSWEDMVAWYKGAACVIVASHFESFSLVGLEAMHLGVPLVMTQETLARTEFEGYAHFCSPKDVDSIEQAAREAMTAPMPAPRPALRWSEVASQYLGVYKRVLQEKDGGSIE